MEHALEPIILPPAEQHERPIETRKIAEISDYWKRQRRGMPASHIDDEITIIDDETIISLRGRPVVFSQDEVAAFNALTELQGKRVAARFLHTILPETPHPGSTVATLADHGLIKIRRPRGESEIDRTTVELNPMLVIRDVRNSFVQEDGEVRHDYYKWRTGDHAREQLSKHGFALLDDAVLFGKPSMPDLEIHHSLFGRPGRFGLELRHHLLTQYFNSDKVRTHEGDKPIDRERARDVARVAFKAFDRRNQPNYSTDRDNNFQLSRHHTTDITNRQKSNITYRPSYSRIETMDDYMLRAFTEQILSLLPPQELSEKSTLGINWFRTHTTVVEGPHQDEEHFVIIYVVDKVGTGARTRLYKRDKYGNFETNAFFSRDLVPGEIVIFRDKDYLHDVTPLIPTADGKSQRDAIIMTLNHPKTYPW